MSRRSQLWWGVVLLGVALAACAAGPNGLVHTANGAGHIAGYWRGVWHGIIAPCTFVISLFTDDVRIYEVHNNGGWYDFGFGTGVLCSSALSRATARRPRRRIRGALVVEGAPAS